MDTQLQIERLINEAADIRQQLESVPRESGIGTYDQGEWTEIARSAYTATPASTSRVTMSDTSMVVKGTALRYSIGGTTYYGVVKDISADAYVDVAGAPLSADLESLEYGTPGKTVEMDIFIPGAAFASAASLLALVGCALRWVQPPAYLVRFSAKLELADTTTNPKINVKIDGSAVSTNDSNNGIQPTASWVDNGLVTVNTSNYRAACGSAIEVAATVAAGTGDAQNLSVSLVWVME